MHAFIFCYAASPLIQNDRNYFFGQVKLSLLLKGVKKNPSSLPACNILIDLNTETTQKGEFVELVNVCDFVYELMFISQVQ